MLGGGAVARGGSPTHDSIVVPGESRTSVAQRVVAGLDDDAEYVVVHDGHGKVQLIRTYRPTWAIVLGVVGILFVGLGVLFFLVKRTETCTLDIGDAPTGVLITVTGPLLPGRRQLIEELATSPVDDSSGSIAPGVPVATPAASVIDHAPDGRPSTDGDADGSTIMRSSVSPSIQGPAATASPPLTGAFGETISKAQLRTTLDPMRLHFDHGQSLTVDSTVLVGRDPEGPGQVVRVPADALGVSKTHLMVRASDGVLWVEDLYSTNGTLVRTPGGEVVHAISGSPVELAAGSVVEFGDRRFEVAD